MSTGPAQLPSRLRMAVVSVAVLAVVSLVTAVITAAIVLVVLHYWPTISASTPAPVQTAPPKSEPVAIKPAVQAKADATPVAPKPASPPPVSSVPIVPAGRYPGTMPDGTRRWVWGWTDGKSVYFNEADQPGSPK